MADIGKEVGTKIKNFRKCKGLSIQQLADTIGKSKSTLSKYENGEISIDLATLYKIAEAMDLRIEQLLYIKAHPSVALDHTAAMSLAKNYASFYAYFFDGRRDKVIRCVLDILAQPDSNRYKTMFYMNVTDFTNYQECENTYWGYTEHYDNLTTITLKNQATHLENITINILSSFLDYDQKWGLMSGVSFRPFMPIAIKMFFSRKPLEESRSLNDYLRISKEDIRTVKTYNMLAIT